MKVENTEESNNMDDVREVLATTESGHDRQTKLQVCNVLHTGPMGTKCNIPPIST
jgi:hypothetical protein